MILISCSVFLALFGFKNNIIKENINYDAKEVSDNIAINSMPIIINNIIAGATYDKKWVSSQRYFLNSKNKVDTEIDIYNKKGKAGTFVIKNIKQDTSQVYVQTTNMNLSNEFVAVAKNSIDLMQSFALTSNIVEYDYKIAKKALGLYRIFNPSINILNAYDVVLKGGELGRILIVTNQKGKSTGAYSSVIFVDQNNNVDLIKYSYVKNLDNAALWSVYSLMFVVDLNADGINEIILQETKEFDVKYSIIEYKNNKFSEVLSTEIKI